MSAQELREAAALMRTRAETAASSPWYAREEVAELPGSERGSTYVRWSVYATDTYGKGNTPYVAEANGREGAEHIASWHPAVALAVADWLEEVAGWREEGLGFMPRSNLADAWGCVERQAIYLARTYLGATQ